MSEHAPASTPPAPEHGPPSSKKGPWWKPLIPLVAPLLSGFVGGGVTGGGVAALLKVSRSSEYVVESGYANFSPNSAWTDSASVRGWRESRQDVWFKKKAPCWRPKVRTAISSLDMGKSETRVDVAVIENEPNERGFTMYARSWSGNPEISWVKVEWIALCPVDDR